MDHIQDHHEVSSFLESSTVIPTQKEEVV